MQCVWIWQVKFSFFQHLKNQDKDTMRETARKKGRNRNPHMEMQRRRYMKGRLGKKVMGYRTCKGRSYLIVIIQGVIVSLGLVTPVTSTDLQRHSWRNHIAKYGESKIEWICADKIRFLWTKITPLAVSISHLHTSAYSGSLGLVLLKVPGLMLQENFLISS